MKLFFDDCMVMFYEVLFTRIGLQLPFSEFELVVLKRLKIYPFLASSRSWVYLRVFQLCVEHKSCKPPISLFFDLFRSRCTSPNNFRNQGLLCLHLVVSWFDPFTLDEGDFLRHFFNWWDPSPPRLTPFYTISVLILLDIVTFRTISIGPRFNSTRMSTFIAPNQTLFH